MLAVARLRRPSSKIPLLCPAVTRLWSPQQRLEKLTAEAVLAQVVRTLEQMQMRLLR